MSCCGVMPVGSWGSVARPLVYLPPPIARYRHHVRARHPHVLLISTQALPLYLHDTPF
jgi:hypothetical protein